MVKGFNWLDSMQLNVLKSKYKKSKKEYDDMVISIIDDKTIPLEIRWKVFSESEVGVRSDYIIDEDLRIPKLKDIIDNRYRGSEVNVIDFVEDDESLYKKHCRTEFRKKYVDFIESILRLRLSSFIIDW